MKSAFTLIEMLVVIAIIGILAGLVVTGAAIVGPKARAARVRTECDALASAIESYKKSKGFYPPDNTNDSVKNSLYYELTGSVSMMANSTPGAPPSFYQTGDGVSPVLGQLNLMQMFNLSGLFNSSTDPVNSPARNFYPGLKDQQHLIVKGTPVFNYTVLGVSVPGPLQLNAATDASGKTIGTWGGPINPWHYVVSNPTHNTGEFDLWMDVIWAGKTNRISNWSKDPQVVY